MNKRLHLLRETLENEDRPLHYGAAAVLLLLYARPLTRIAGTRQDQLSLTGDGETVFDDQPASRPPPLRHDPSATPRQPAQHEHRKPAAPRPGFSPETAHHRTTRQTSRQPLGHLRLLPAVATKHRKGWPRAAGKHELARW
jgi:hypothetical protein